MNAVLTHVTKYEKLNYQADLCMIVAHKNRENGDMRMANFWKFVSVSLRAKAAAMPISQAMEAAE